MRGLALFISDLRKCSSKEDEIKRINKEMAHIRSKFKDKPLDGYQKKKYTCKLLFMFLLGYPYDFGHMEAVNLLSSNAYSEKQIGYLYISVVTRKDHSFMPLVLNALKNDLLSNNTYFQNLALQFVANNAAKDMAESLGNHVLDMLISSDSEHFVRQTAALTLLQLLRIKPDIIDSDQVSNRIVNLISNHHLGVVTASVSLVDFLASTFPSQYQSCVSHVISRLSRIITHTWLDSDDYYYYHTNAPWLSVKLLRLLQKYPFPTDAALKERLKETFTVILNKSQEPPKSRKFEHNNAKYAVVFEAISTIIHMNTDNFLLYKAIKILGSALKQKEPNLRYMSMDMMSRLSDNECLKGNIQKHWESVLDVLRTEADMTIKKCAIDLLYSMCDVNNVKQILEELLYFLEEEDESIHGDVVLKAAFLAEQFNTDLEWYVDTIFNILQICADNVNAEIWYSLVKVVMDNERVQEYAARKSFTVLEQDPCQDFTVKAAGYILGEFGHLISKNPYRSHLKQLNLLQEKFAKCSPTARALLLTTYMKYFRLYPDLKDVIQSILRDNINSRSENEEIQQRSVEYLKLSETVTNTTLATVLDAIPPFQCKEPAILKSLEKKKFQNLNKMSDNFLNKNALKCSSMCTIANTNETVNRESIKDFRTASRTNLHPSKISSNLELLTDAFSKPPKASVISVPTTTSGLPIFPFKIDRNFLQPSNERFLHHFLFSENGILYEDGIIKITMESEFQKHYGRFHLMYENKSIRDLIDFTVEGNFSDMQEKCSIWFKPCFSYLLGSQSMRQDIHLECLSEFIGRPSLILKFKQDIIQKRIELKLPLTVNKFVEPAAMSPDLFMKRWKNFESNGQQVVKDFAAKYPMIYGVTRTKLKGFRVGVIENVGNNSTDLYCSGIFFTRTRKIGFLVILERYPLDNRYRSIVRSSHQTLSQNICNLLSELL